MGDKKMQRMDQCSVWISTSMDQCVHTSMQRMDRCRVWQEAKCLSTRILLRCCAILRCGALCAWPLDEAQRTEQIFVVDDDQCRRRTVGATSR